MPRETNHGRQRQRRRGTLVLTTAAALPLALASCTGTTTPPSELTSPAATSSSPSPRPNPPVTSSAASTPSTTPTATTAATGTTPRPSFADVNGTWCGGDDDTCLTIALPRISFAAHPGLEQYVWPSWDVTGDPSTWSYADVAPGADGCYVTVTDVYPGTSGAEFVYCPAGSVSTEVNDLSGDPTVDRVFITQEIDATPYHRQG